MCRNEKLKRQKEKGQTAVRGPASAKATARRADTHYLGAFVSLLFKIRVYLCLSVVGIRPSQTGIKPIKPIFNLS